MKILLIEPDMAISKIYKKYLNKFGHEVSISQTSQQAISQIDTDKPDIILLEPQLTSHNGYEFLYELRSYTDLQDITLIINSMIPEESTNINQIITTGIVLRRINYMEADRIITILTPDYGKLTLFAKGVRKANSKLAGS